MSSPSQNTTVPRKTELFAIAWLLASIATWNVLIGASATAQESGSSSGSESSSKSSDELNTLEAQKLSDYIFGKPISAFVNPEISSTAAPQPKPEPQPETPAPIERSILMLGTQSFELRGNLWINQSPQPDPNQTFQDLAREMERNLKYQNYGVRAHEVLEYEQIRESLLEDKSKAQPDGSKRGVLDLMAPHGVEDYQELQVITQRLAQRAVAATVAIYNDGATGSGVIVSADGYILTAAHVTSKIGQNMQVILSDGRHVTGVALGRDDDTDCALIKIDPMGGLPMIPMAAPGTLSKPGDWCIATGHGGGVETNPVALVRLGRVIQADRYQLRTDCTVEPGDSGGPLIDLRGYVVGIHSLVSNNETRNLHVAIDTFRQTWDSLVQRKISKLRPSSEFLAMFDPNKDGKLSLDELPSEPLREAYTRLVNSIGVPATQPQDLESVRTKIGLDFGGIRRDTDGSSLTPLIPIPYENNTKLHPYIYTQGIASYEVLRDTCQEAAASTCRVYVDNEQVALGTIVDSEGWIVTKASELFGGSENSRITCQCSNGRVFRAVLVNIDHQYDLGWLLAEFDDLPPISWADGAVPLVGTCVSCPNKGLVPCSFGIISAGPRLISAEPGRIGVGGSRTRSDAYIESIKPNGPASRSDLAVGDVITSVHGVSISSFHELQYQVQRYRGGDVIPLKVLRGGQLIDVGLRLGNLSDVIWEGRSLKMTGKLNDRRSGFPLAITHDSLISPNQCGGPVVNLQGKAIGINIARSQRSATLALLPETIIRLLAETKQKMNTSEAVK